MKINLVIFCFNERLCCVNVMRHSKRLPSQNSKDICPRCTRIVNIPKERHCPGLLTYYRNLCKSSKCLIHRRCFLPKVNVTKVNLDKKKLLHDKKTEVRNTPLINVFKSPCVVDEFEEDLNTSENIDYEILAKIESAVENFDQSTEIYFADMVGYKMIKEIINRTVIWPLKKPDIFKGLRTAPKGILLFGPPGTGKTFLGQYIASETKSTFFKISPSTLTSKWLGDSEKLVRTMFLVAKARQPSIIFIDEIDGFLSKRTLEENEFIRRMKNEFFVCMDGNDTIYKDRIMVIGATNRPQELDEAARHRFLKRFYISLPGEIDRSEILLKLLERECHSLEEIDLYDIVKKTKGYSVADLKNLCQEAAMGPIKALAENALSCLKPAKIRPISTTDFFYALQLIKPTVSQEQIKSCEEWDSLYGYGGDENSIQN